MIKCVILCKKKKTMQQNLYYSNIFSGPLDFNAFRIEVRTFMIQLAKE